MWIWAAFRGQDGPNGAARVPVRPCFEHLRDFSDSFLTEFSEIRQEFIANSSTMTSMDLLCNERGGASPRVLPSYGKEVFQITVRE